MTQNHTPTLIQWTSRTLRETAQTPTSPITRRRRRLRRFLAVLLLGSVVTSSGGCSIFGALGSTVADTECLDEFMISHRNQVMATKAWLRVQHCYRNQKCWKDLRAGFIDGYLEVATGGSGCTPTIVSPQYWGWKHQCAGGQCSINAWFEGFPLGAKAAEQDGIGHFNQIRMNQVPLVNRQPAMTGSMAPTPAAVQPASPPPAVMRPLPTGSTQLPPGVVLGEGEMLVPGATRFEDVISGPGESANTVGKPAISAPAVPKGPAMPKGSRVPRPVPTADPDLGLYSPSDAFPMPGQDIVPELVPRPGAGFVLQDANSQSRPSASLTNVNGGTPEPTQQEIDSVIEEIFGRPTGAAKTPVSTR